jgi:hypothetical protein
VKNIRLAILAGLVILSATIFAALTAQHADLSESHPVSYGQQELARFLKKRGIPVSTVNYVRRNSSADEIFVFLSHGNTNAEQMVGITTNGIASVVSPSRRAFPVADGHFAAWFAENASVVRFSGGQKVSLPKFALFDVDTAGRYFVVGEKPSTTWLGTTEFPEKKQKISDQLLAHAVFTKSNVIYICGFTDTNPASQASHGQPTVAICIEVTKDADGFQIVRRHTFPWSDGVLDLDPYSDRLLLLNSSEVSSIGYTYDLKTGRRKRVGYVRDFQFFMRTDPLSKSP